MARITKDKKLRPSILDRLFDDDLHHSSELKTPHHQLVRELRVSISRDLESLLNTRFRIVKPSSHFSETDKSIFNYGLPDLATVNVRDQKELDKFIKLLEKTIKSYEPRFKSVKITFIDNDNSLDRSLRFRIDTVIYAEPIPEVVIFDSALDSVTRSVSVKEI